uniref:Uncharacterized protein n=1 Tax=Cannabis sativa TaxID=3483 RepID=A0A803NHM4_CANSA
MAQEFQLEKDKGELDIAKVEANLAHTKPFIGGQGSAHLAEASTQYASPKTFNDNSWYPVSGATHHLTPNAQNLAYNFDYFGDQ